MANESHDYLAEDDIVEEWGPTINGYRFVGSKGSKRYFKQRHRLVTDHGYDGYDWSYMELPEYTTVQHDAMDEEEEQDPEGYTYDSYYKDWEEIKTNGEKTIIFPLKQTGDTLDGDSVSAFLRTSSDYIKVLKIERIRWHPDKMLNVLRIKNDDIEGELLKRKITTTFQIINELYEHEHGVKR